MVLNKREERQVVDGQKTFSMLFQIADMTAGEVGSFRSRPNGAAVVGHYTALVWADTTDVGCGFMERDLVQGGTTYVAQVYT